jgi:hypothetical protein
MVQDLTDVLEFKGQNWQELTDVLEFKNQDRQRFNWIYWYTTNVNYIGRFTPAI